MHIFTHGPSDGATALKEALGIKKIKAKNSLFKGAAHKVVINWGAGEITPEISKCRVLNHPNKLNLTINKKTFFETVKKSKYSDIIPDFTSDPKVVTQWIAEGHWVVARTVLNGSGGAGIVMLHKDMDNFEIVKAPLYVKYVPKEEEYRVHVVAGKAVDIQRKTLSNEAREKAQAEGKEINFKVRNLENGFIYQRGNINPNQAVYDVAVKAMEVVDLDFGAVDIVFGKKDKRAYVLEINSAPGLQGQTVNSYAEAFRKAF